MFYFIWQKMSVSKPVRLLVVAAAAILLVALIWFVLYPLIDLLIAQSQGTVIS
ncbi:MAG: hypothetical protein KF916_04305 [Microbacteriaceae bacterium]|nr:hypothetical protein [Microbacteriaceae bacterium]